MKQVAILVEGQTEERFVKQILVSFFRPKGIYVEPIIINTKRTSTKLCKGGTIKFDKSVTELRRLLNPKYTMVTTFFDFYGLEESFFPEGITNLNDPYDKVDSIERKMLTCINNPKFLPYIQLYEFESFLFIDAEITCNNLSNCNKPSVKASINKALIEVQYNPELINNSRDTAPSKRILKVYSQYQKTIDGPRVCSELGINKIMTSCSHFKDWIEKISDF